MSRATLVSIAAAMVCVAAAPAGAQSGWTDRGLITINADIRVSSLTFTGVAHPVDFGEPATVTTTYDVKPAPGFDAGVGVRIWRNLGVGVDVAFVTKSSKGSIDAQVPHPFFFNKPRAVSGSAGGLGHRETAAHIQAIWMMPVRQRWLIALAGGPSWIGVGQDVVSDIAVQSTYPYDSATYAGATSSHVSKGHWGFNVGADVSYRVWPGVGVGGGVNFSRAKVPLPTANGDTVTVVAGGARVAAGLRVRL
jgi:hypothetical protein